MRNDAEMNVLMEQLRHRGLQYYTEIKGAYDGKHICCLFPEHPDRSPSMMYWEEAEVFHCFSCGRVADIFTLAHLFEGKPLAGPDFYEENVFYLAERYGLEFEHLRKELTPEELVRQQYFRAAKLLSDYVTSHVNKDYLEERSITDATARTLLIGSVDSFENCKKYLTQAGISEDMLEEMGVIKFNINENKLILIIKDEYGRPVSFVSREMKYETKKLIKNFEGVKEKLTDEFLSSDERREKLIAITGLSGIEIDKYFKTPKYSNGNKTQIFNKSRMFYGWSDIQRKYNPNIPLVTCEGYIDFITAFQRGITNIVAIGSASFTDEHIEVIERTRQIKKVAIALDNDKVGKARTGKILERLLKTKTIKEYSFAIYKNDYKDIDETLINNPDIMRTGQIFDLKTIFEFELEVLKEETKGDFDQGVVFDRFVDIIAKEKEPKARATKARGLSKVLTDFDYKTIIDQINFVIDGKEQEFGKEVVSKAEVFLKEIKKNPASAIKSVEMFKMEVEEIEKDYEKKPKNIFETALDYFGETESKKDEENLFSINFDIPWLNHLNIQPGNTVVLSSLANTGKSTIFQAIVRKTLLKNMNAHIFFATTDDPGQKVYANLISTFSGLPRDYCANPVYHKYFGIRTENPNCASYERRDEMHKIYLKHSENIRTLIEQKRLILLDVKNKIDNFKNLASAMKEIAENQDLEDSYKMLILDSANKVTVDGIMDENQRAAYISENIKKLSETYGFLSFVNFELNKMKNNARLSQFNLSGSRRMFYDCDVLGFVYNPSRNLQGDTRLVWRRKLDNGKEIDEPIIVTMQEKSKAGNNERNNRPYFYKLTSENNRLEPVHVGTPEHNTYEAIWEEEFNTKYE